MGIADVLFTPRQQKMLAPLLLNPAATLRLSELLALSGAGRGASQKHIQNFIDAGLLKESRQGNQRYLQINEHFPLYPELRGICLKSFGLSEGLREALRPLQDRISEAFVFGSVASGTDHAESDVDLMVIGSVDLLPLLDAVAEYEQRLCRTVHVNLHSPQDWATLRESDAVIQKIIAAPILRLLPYDTTA